MSFFRYVVHAALLSGLASSQTIDNCPTSLPRDQYTLVFGDQCFQFVVYQEKDYPEAEQDCKSRGGTLAITKTREVQQFLQEKAVGVGLRESLWIGLSDQVKENTFVWEDGTTLNDSQSHWGPEEGPRTGIIQHSLEDCVATNTAKDGLWEDYHCENELFGLINYEKHYICSYVLIPQ